MMHSTAGACVKTVRALTAVWYTLVLKCSDDNILRIAHHGGRIRVTRFELQNVYNIVSHFSLRRGFRVQ